MIHDLDILSILFKSLFLGPRMTICVPYNSNNRQPDKSLTRDLLPVAGHGRMLK